MSEAEAQPAAAAYTNGSNPAALKDSPWYVRSVVYILERFGLSVVFALAVGAAWWRSEEIARIDRKEGSAALVAAIEKTSSRIEAATLLVAAELKKEQAILAELRADMAAHAAATARPVPRAR